MRLLFLIFLVFFFTICELTAQNEIEFNPAKTIIGDKTFSITKVRKGEADVIIQINRGIVRSGIILPEKIPIKEFANPIIEIYVPTNDIYWAIGYLMYDSLLHQITFWYNPKDNSLTSVGDAYQFYDMCVTENGMYAFAFSESFMFFSPNGYRYIGNYKEMWGDVPDLINPKFKKGRDENHLDILDNALIDEQGQLKIEVDLLKRTAVIVDDK